MLYTSFLFAHFVLLNTTDLLDCSKKARKYVIRKLFCFRHSSADTPKSLCVGSDHSAANLGLDDLFNASKLLFHFVRTDPRSHGLLSFSLIEVYGPKQHSDTSLKLNGEDSLFIFFFALARDSLPLLNNFRWSWPSRFARLSGSSSKQTAPKSLHAWNAFSPRTALTGVIPVAAHTLVLYLKQAEEPCSSQSLPPDDMKQARSVIRVLFRLSTV